MEPYTYGKVEDGIVELILKRLEGLMDR